MDLPKSLTKWFTAAVVVLLSSVVTNRIATAVCNYLLSIISRGFGKGILLYPDTIFTLVEVFILWAPWFKAAVVVLLGLVVKVYLPLPVSNYLDSIYQDYFFPRLTLIIEEKGDFNSDQIYEAATIYLREKINDSPKPKRFRCRKTYKQNTPICDIARDAEVIDNFRNHRLEWKLREEKTGHPLQLQPPPDKKFFELTFDKGFENDVVEHYLPYVLDSAEEIQREEKVIKLYSLDCNPDIPVPTGREWGCTILEHPATFDKLAMSPELKRSLKNDLDRFVNRKDWYKKVGRAWKRGYLIYGPPGTGKSSLIAAMANYLKFDIYFFDISNVKSDSILRNMLVSTSIRSMIVIEDIDCAQLEKRGEEKKDSYYEFTLSGLLNVMDGLWSSCGDERILVFTTNHKDLLERLDPALFRPGRIDMHVPMSYCNMDAFKMLASTYLDVDEEDHRLYGQIEELFENAEVTPAEIAEEFSRTEDPDAALEAVVEVLKQKTKLENAINK